MAARKRSASPALYEHWSGSGMASKRASASSERPQGRLQNARVSSSGAGEVRRGAEEVGQRRRRAEVREEFLAMVVVEVPRHATERHAVSSHSQGPPFTLTEFLA